MNSPKSSILKSLYFSSTQSIAELSDSIGKSIPSITKSINELAKENSIIENGLRASTGGRRAKSYSLNKEKHGLLIAVAIDQFHTSITAFTTDNQQVIPTQLIETNLNHDTKSFEKINTLILDTLNTLKPSKILAIGITIPGFLNSESGLNNSYATTSPLYNLRDRIKTSTQLPVFIENDSSAIAIVEQNFGKARETENTLVVNLSWGVGLGMIIGNKLFKGSSGYAGEFSHIPLADQNKLCSCGKKGCLEVEASLRYAIEYIHENLAKGERSSLEDDFALNKQITFEQLFQAFEKGDQLAIKAIKKIAYMLGKGLATLIHILNPEKIIISGKGAIFGNILLNEIQSSMQEFCIPKLALQTEIQLSNLYNIQLLSSACIAVQQMKWETH